VTKTIVPGRDETHLHEAIERFEAASKVVALTGAGISVESGIPDFRSPGGLWTEFSPDEYATIDVFHENPEKAWRLYRAMAESLVGAEPNPAHIALAELESAGRLAGVITQNVDSLHQAAGSRNVIEIHGDHRRLQCLRCRTLEDVTAEHFQSTDVPLCARCGTPLKPNVVLFGEGVRGMNEIAQLLNGCDLLLVVGTSAQVYPAAGLPSAVKESGGLIYEFNTEATALTTGRQGGNILAGLTGFSAGSARTDYFFKGPASGTLGCLGMKA